MTVTSYSYEEYRKRLNRFTETGDLLYRKTLLFDFFRPIFVVSNYVSLLALTTITEQYVYQVCSGRPKHIASYLSTLI